MRIGILTFSISVGNGQSRFAINLSRGLINEGKDISLFAYSCSKEDAEKLRSMGITVFPYKIKLSKIDMYRSISDSDKVFSELLKIVRNAKPCDYYIVLNDELQGILNYKERGKWVYLSNGDLTLLFLNKGFIDKYSPFTHFIKNRFVSQLLKHQNRILNYDYLFANSKFTQTIMSFVLNSYFTDYIYPPVDTEVFKRNFKSNDSDEKGYALVMLRNNAEPMVTTVQQLAKKIPVKIVGEAKVNGAITLGRISDEELVNTYSNALVTIGPSKQEFFGYATAESLSCGTPVIAFKQGAAVEMINPNQNGWLVDTNEELLNKLIEIFKIGYDTNMRDMARKSAEKFSISASTNKLINLLR